jgi:hypothetical protein
MREGPSLCIIVLLQPISKQDCSGLLRYRLFDIVAQGRLLFCCGQGNLFVVLLQYFRCLGVSGRSVPAFRTAGTLAEGALARGGCAASQEESPAHDNIVVHLIAGGIHQFAPIRRAILEHGTPCVTGLCFYLEKFSGEETTFSRMMSSMLGNAFRAASGTWFQC